MSEKPGQRDDPERNRENEPDAEELREGFNEEAGRRASTGPEEGDDRGGQTRKEEDEARSE